MQKDGSQLFYASLLLNVVVQASSKVSVNLLFNQLQPFRVFLIANFVSLGFNVAWAVASLLAVAFRCRLPYPWKLGPNRCVDMVG